MAGRRAHVEDAMDVDAAPRASAAPDSRMKALEQQLEHARLARQIAVPTVTERIKARLREFGEPITLFGETQEDRRNRLREVLTSKVEEAVQNGMDPDEAVRVITEVAKTEEEQAEEQEERRVPGGMQLLSARKELTNFTIGRAKKRIAFQRAESEIMGRRTARLRVGVKSWLRQYEIAGSQMYAPRITSVLKFSPNGQFLAVGTWGGRVAILNLELEDQMELRGHSEGPVVLAWADGPLFTNKDDTRAVHEVLDQSSGLYMATGDGSGVVRLFAAGNMEDEIAEKKVVESDSTIRSTRAIQSLEGHSGRITALQFHHQQKYLLSSSHDETWRLWDVEKSVSLLSQRAHSREVQCLSLNVDGSLVATGGLDSYARVWDLRTGSMVMETDGHVQPVYGVDWSPNGYRFMSGSADGKLKVWDLRKSEEYAELPAHQSGVSAVKWFQGTDGPLHADMPPQAENGDYKPKISGTFFVTAGFDKELKIWSADDWALVGELSGHTGNITCVDIANDAKQIATGSRDMTIKLWGQPDGSSIYEQNL